jgi:hypothetical protein
MGSPAWPATSFLAPLLCEHRDAANLFRCRAIPAASIAGQEKTGNRNVPATTQTLSL